MNKFKFNIGQMVEICVEKGHKQNGRVGRVFMREGYADEMNVYLIKEADGETFGALENILRRYVEPFVKEDK
jgi:hypothetical protein